MLKMKPTCERCAADLAADAAGAYICSFECTFCAACVLTLGSCPNCSGELVPRPQRAMALLEKFPPVA
jgi:hypothetical protein